MTLETCIAFAIAFSIFVAIPGPGVFAVAARSLALGVSKNLSYIGGMVMAHLVMVTVTFAGLSTLVQQISGIMLAIKLLGGLYLVYLGVKLWRAGGQAMKAEGKMKGLGFIAGLSASMCNPKNYVFYMAFLPQFIDLTTATMTDGVVLAAIASVCLASVMLGYTIMAAQARRLLTSERRMKWLNRGAGAILIGSGGAIAAS